MSVVNKETALHHIKKWQSEGLKVGYTSGVFDLLHAGHLDYLKKSKEFCDKLVIGVNADSSVKKNKGPKRPIVSEAHRAELVAGLEVVDCVFIFSELNNNQNIEFLKPDVYIKAGDYKPEQLSSAPLIQAQGGEVVIIPVVNDISSSQIIGKIESQAPIEFLKTNSVKKRPVVFLDRDGVINKEVSYLHQPEKFELTDTCLDGMKKLADLDVAVIVVTNQAGIGLGYFDHEDFYRVNQAMFKALKPSGISIEKIFYCPHSFSEACFCRKPATGMLEKAFEQGTYTKNNSFIIGDQETDIQAGKTFGIETILLSNKANETQADYKAESFLEAITYIEKKIKS